MDAVDVSVSPDNAQAIFHIVRDAVFILNESGRILYANPAAGKLYGYPVEQLTRMALTDLAAPESLALINEYLTKVPAFGARLSCRQRCHHGDEFPVEMSFQVLRGETDVVTFVIVREHDPALLQQEADNYLLERILNTELGIVYIYDLLEHRSVYVNRHWLTDYGYSLEETQQIECKPSQIFHPEDLQRIEEHHENWRHAGDEEIRTIEYRLRNTEGGWCWIGSNETVFSRDDKGFVRQILVTAYDITERKHTEVLLNGQNRILEMIATGKALPAILTDLIRMIEDQAPGMLGSILLLDSEGKHVRHGAAPNLPLAFIQAVDGQPIGPKAGSCGTAAYTRKAVYVEDIATDPLWEMYKDAALTHGLRACWSTPIFDMTGKVLGTFAMYYLEPSLPHPYHLKLIRTATHLASIAISRHYARQALTTAKSRLQKAQQVAGMGFLEWDLTSDQIFCSDEIYNIFGLGRNEEYTTPAFVTRFVHPDDLHFVQENLEQAVKGIKEYNIDHRIVRADGRVVWVHAQAELVEEPEKHRQILLGTVLDITRRKAAEAKVVRLGQLYAALSQCNQAIVRCKSEEELFAQICQDAVKFGGMKMVWIGIRDEDRNTVRPVAYFGRGVDYLNGFEISLDSDTSTGKGPTATAVRENRAYWCQDFQHDPISAPWHERAKTYGWGSAASLPLSRHNKVVGAIVVYADVANFFDQDVQNLLLEMAMDISFALEQFDKEKERLRVEAALRESEQHLRTIVETEPECVKLLDADGQLVEMNAAGLAMLQAESLEQVKTYNMLEFILPPYRDEFIQLHRRVMNGETVSFEFEIEGIKGQQRWMGMHAAPMRDANGNITGLLGISRDITEQKISDERIHYMANYDALTGLPNRIQMADHLHYALSLMKRSHGQLAVLFIDIDRFKDINDTLGHSIGDALLIQIAERLRTTLREEDTASRMGGDEFIVILPECGAKEAANVAEKLLDVLSAPFHIESYELVVTASIGIAIFPNDGIDLETLSRCADTAMYRAKSESRDAYRFFTAEMEIRAKRNMHLINALRYALDMGQFEVHYQPQVDISNGRIIGVEALLRWHHTELGAVSPAEFIPVAEDSRLIMPIGEWVLRTAVGQLKAWQDKGYPPIVMAVNLSAVQFRHASLSNLVSRILTEEGVDANYLELELTEGVAMQDLKGGALTMNNLHDSGVRLSIDDFGTGYSSLSYLKKFKVYKLKIDKAFVQDITTDPEDKAIVAAIIGMAKNLGLQTIAEGVETAEQFEYLREQGCDEAQGYFHSRPMPPAEVEKLLAGQAKH